MGSKERRRSRRGSKKLSWLKMAKEIMSGMWPFKLKTQRTEDIWKRKELNEFEGE